MSNEHTDSTATAEIPDKNASTATNIPGMQGRISSELSLDTLLKVPVSLSIEVGRTRMTINDFLETREGSVIELERLMDEPLDILVNGALIAHGVVILANERFGIQITDIVSPHERVRML